MEGFELHCMDYMSGRMIWVSPDKTKYSMYHAHYAVLFESAMAGMQEVARKNYKENNGRRFVPNELIKWEI